MDFLVEYSNCDDYWIYVDGSYVNGCAGFGVVILKNGDLAEELYGPVPDTFSERARNVTGEIVATEKAVQWCQEHSIQEVSIFYDYKGIEKWATGEWKTKQPLTREYADFIRNCGVKIYWHKVESHTGDRWNNRADELAKKGATCTVSEQSTPTDPIAELQKKGEGFALFLTQRGFDAELRGIYNSNCAKLKILHNDKLLGYLNIYRTKKEPYLVRYHELKDSSYQARLEALWQEYEFGEPELPLF